MHCPYCGHKIDCHAHEFATPKYGDIGVCLYCTGIMKFGNGDMLRPTDEDIRRFKADPELWAEINRKQAKIDEFRRAEL